MNGCALVFPMSVSSPVGSCAWLAGFNSCKASACGRSRETLGLLVNVAVAYARYQLPNIAHKI
jgi:hypothetical protein